jgi:predicted ribosomally synthesized peptide with SipW-like signal peptide
MAITRKRKGIIRAILAGGVVLGVGAAVTLAAWNASEFATGTFQAGTFTLEGSTDGTAYASHPAAPGATLAFSAGVNNLSPSATTYSAYWVRLGAGTTANATVTLQSGGTSGTVTNLTYSLLQLAAAGTCNATATGTTLVPAGTAVGTVPGSTTFTLSAGSPTTQAGTAVQVCIVITAGSGLQQGQTGTATWQFAAQSS